MPLSDTPTLHPANWTRAIKAQVPRKALRDLVNRLRFGPDAPQSDECLWVAARDVAHFYKPDPARGAPRLNRHHSGQVRPGTWDMSRLPWTTDAKLESCRLHFQDGVAWRDTPIWARLTREIAEGRTPDDCHSEADLAARYDALDRLYDEMSRTRTLRPRRDLPEHFRREHGGILVHLARDGTLLRASGGMHRMALARLLDLERVPVQLGVVHPLALDHGHLQRLRA